MQIRKATITDQPRLQHLMLEFEVQAASALPHNLQQIRAYRNREMTITDTSTKYLSKPKYQVFVAEENGQFVGYIAGKIKKRKERVFDKEGYILHWFVKPEYQSQKIGQQLFDAIMRAFQAAGCTHLGVDTHAQNLRAIAIYEHLGFTKRLVTFFKVLS